MALITAALSVACYTLSSSYAVGVAENKADLAIPTLDALSGTASSAYELEEVVGSTLPADDLSIFKYLFDSGDSSYTAVQYNVHFDESLGDENPGSEGDIYLKWSQNATTKI